MHQYSMHFACGTCLNAQCCYSSYYYTVDSERGGCDSHTATATLGVRVAAVALLLY
jgi:hypothetical protein